MQNCSTVEQIPSSQERNAMLFEIAIRLFLVSFELKHGM
jgi:hypothetical protein